MADDGDHVDAGAFHQPKLKSFQLPNRKESMQNIDIKKSLGDIFTCRNDFNNVLGIQQRNLSIAIVLNLLPISYVNLIATGIVFNIRASGSHIGLVMALSEHRRGIISVFDRRSMMNQLYWHNQQVGYLCFIIPPETKFRGGILDSPCSSVRLSVCPSVRGSVSGW